jgi:hypothetical protein
VQAYWNSNGFIDVYAYDGKLSDTKPDGLRITPKFLQSILKPNKIGTTFELNISVHTKNGWTRVRMMVESQETSIIVKTSDIEISLSHDEWLSILLGQAEAGIAYLCSNKE